MKRYNYYPIALMLLVLGCAEHGTNLKSGGFTDNATKLFTKIPDSVSSIDFKNRVVEDFRFNFLTYPYLYAGAGLAVGDLDKDGLEDIYLVSNQGQNKLYKNKGNFVFEDITARSNTQDSLGFSTGVTMLDVNNDGWLDLYVCKAASYRNDEGRRNKLFVNQQDGTFKEDGKKWGLDDPGYSTQAYQLDYDNDGDLDLYVVNYRYDFRNNTVISGDIQRNIEEVTSDQLYRNDGTRYNKVTGAAGLYNKAWGLGAAVGDFNNDGWDDIYVCNDYLEPDVMYINQQNGTFKDEIGERLKHISFNSMGVDYADLNNDRHPDLITLDMLAENYARSKENMASMSTENFMTMVKVGYHHSYMANMLHINTGNGVFKETGQLSGIAKTDWSWAPLIIDFDNDGLKDIFISNGVMKDYTNQDFRSELKSRNAQGQAMRIEDVLDLLPSEKLHNYIYKNNGNFSFSNKVAEWGLEDPTFSNGAAYADFDNDGDMDLVVSNINDVVGLYRNNSNQNYLQVKLSGPAENLMGLGANVIVETEGTSQVQKLYLTRGYQSSVTSTLHFGLGQEPDLKSVRVEWPDGNVSEQSNIKPNTVVEIQYESNSGSASDLAAVSTKKIIYLL